MKHGQPETNASSPTRPSTRNGAAARRSIATASLAGLAALWAARWWWRARYLYEWDSAQYALGILRFDVREHRPHPPGYPLWILALKAIHLFVRDLNTAQIVLDFVVTGIATAVFWSFAKKLYGRAPAFLGAGLLLFSPVVIFYSEVASTYPADLFISTLIGALSIRVWSGDTRIGPWIVFVWAIAAGVRQSGAVMMAPLMTVALLRAYRFDMRRWAVTAAIGASTFAAWYVPTACMNGGLVTYQAVTRATILGYFHLTSALFGAPVATHLAMLRANAIWAGAAVFVATVATVTVWTAGRLLSSKPPTPTPKNDSSAFFYPLWIAPNVLYVTLLHSVKPGYLVLDLPPFILILVRFAAEGLARLDTRWRGSATAIAAITALAAGAVTTGLVRGRYSATLNRTSLASIRDSDEDTRAIERIVASDPGPASTLVIVVSSGNFGPTIRSLPVHMPDVRVASLSRDGPDGLLRQYRHYEFRDDYGESKVLAPEVRRILWVYEKAGTVLRPVRAGIPSTAVVYYGRATRVVESQLGDGELDAYVTLDRTYHLVRTGTAPDPTCRLGAGFIAPVSAGDLLWAGGPRSEIVVYARDPSPVRIALRVAVSPSPEQEVTVTANGAPIATVRPSIGTEMLIDFQGLAGKNRVVFDYSRYNHHPDEFAPLDPRPFALAFREIRCEWGAERRLLFVL